MLTSTNPLLREAALAEIARLGAAGPADLSALASLLQDANSGIRSSALRIIRGVMQLPAQEMEETEKRTVLELCRERARNDPSEQVRTVAVRVIGAWPKKEDVVGDLRAIARSDSSQSVRYEAMRILFAWGMTGSSRDP
jgi:HEAT repeat protein